MPVGGAMMPGGVIPGAQPLFNLNGLPSQVNLNQLFSQRGGVPTPIQPQPMVAQQKSAPIQAQVNAGLQTRTDNQNAANQSISDFTKQFLESRGKVNEAAAQEQNAISSIYGNGAGSIEQQLNALNRQRQAATNQAAAAAGGRAQRAYNFSRAAGGNSSYLDRVLGQNLMNIGVNAAGQGADQSRADLQYLTGQRTGAIGRRQQIIDNLLNRNFAPVDAANRMEGVNISNLGGLAALDYGNNVYSTSANAYRDQMSVYDDLVRRGLARPY